MTILCSKEEHGNETAHLDSSAKINDRNILKGRYGRRSKLMVYKL